MQESTEQKQNLLKDEIFEKGYDIQHFSEYMDTIKPNGGNDIDIWTIEELQKAINDYQEAQKGLPKQDTAKQAQEIQQSIQGEQQSQIPLIMQQILAQNTNLGSQKIKQLFEEQDDNNFFKVINCKKLIPNQLSQAANIKIEILNYEKKSGTMLTFSYVNYKIYTLPFGWEVTRRYSDFQWLRDTLSKLYPGICVPPIPKKSATRNFQELHLHKRMKFLERLLNKITKSKELVNDKFVEAFLSYEDKEFKQSVKDSEKVPKVTKLDSIISPTERVTLSINPQIENFLKNTTELVNNLDFFYRRVRKQSKQLLLDFDTVSNTLYSLGDTFAQLYNVSNHFNLQVNEGGNSSLEEMFIMLNNLMVQWGNILAQQIKHVQDNFCTFFKFYHHEVNSFKEYLKQREQAHTEFEKFKQRLDLKKEKLFQGNEIGRWEIPTGILNQLKKEEIQQNKKITMLLMLPKETSAQMDLRDIFGYYNNSAFEEIQRVQSQNIYQWADHFINFVQIQSSSVTQLHMLWADTLTMLQAFGKQPDKKLMYLMEGNAKPNQNNLKDKEQVMEDG